jgi:hypothetical protein
MLWKHSRHGLAGLLALAFAFSLSARGLFWDFLGYTQVDRSQDHGRIEITRRDVHFRTIQLRVSGEAIFFDRLVVHFDDGTSHELLVSDRISPGGRNYIIDLRGERALETVEFWYYKEAWEHNPRVSLYGVRAPESDGQNRPGNPSAGNPHGSQRYSRSPARSWPTTILKPQTWET